LLMQLPASVLFARHKVLLHQAQEGSLRCTRLHASSRPAALRTPPRAPSLNKPTRTAPASALQADAGAGQAPGNKQTCAPLRWSDPHRRWRTAPSRMPRMPRRQPCQQAAGSTAGRHPAASMAAVIRSDRCRMSCDRSRALRAALPGASRPRLGTRARAAQGPAAAQLGPAPAGRSAPGLHLHALQGGGGGSRAKVSWRGK
jgi:hypothetical protein